MGYKKIKENPDLVKDTNSGAVINTNANAFVQRREQMRISAEKDAKLSQLESDVAELKKMIKKLGSK
jgi:uncharacterized protein YceH (UPF0502 family)